MEVLYTPITIDLITPNPLPVLKAKQGDTARGALITLTAGAALTLTDETVRVFIKKPDGHIVYADCEIENGKVKAAYSYQMVAAAGKAELEIEIDDGSRRLSTPIAILQVMPSNISEAAEPSTSEAPALVGLIGTASTDEAGLVKVDGETITADTDGTLRVIGGGSGGGAGEDGGYYTPEISQSEEQAAAGTMTVSYIASKADMEAVDPQTVNLPAGPRGDKGDPGAAGSPGAAGKDGTSVTVQSVSESTEDGGSNVVTFSDGKTVTIKNGSKGSDGSAGKDGSDGNDGLAIYAYNGDFGVATIAGDSVAGSYEGANVVSLGNRTLQTGDLLIDISGHVVFVSETFYSSGDTRFNVEYVTTIQGAPGNDGIDGSCIYAYDGDLTLSKGQGRQGDYVTSKITSLGDRILQSGDLLIDEVGGVYRVTSLYYDATEFDAEYVNTITGAPGEKGDPGATPVKGTDYFTEADKTEMVNSVIASLKTETWTFTLEDGSTVNKVVLLK